MIRITRTKWTETRLLTPIAVVGIAIGLCSSEQCAMHQRAEFVSGADSVRGLLAGTRYVPHTRSAGVGLCYNARGESPISDHVSWGAVLMRGGTSSVRSSFPLIIAARPDVHMSRTIGSLWVQKPMIQFFGAKLKDLRRQHARSQIELAHQLGLASHTSIAHLEAGRKAPSLDLVLRCADAFAVTTDYLLRDTLPVEAAEAHRLAPPPPARRAAAFGTTLRQLRHHHHLTQSDLARRLEPSITSLSQQP